MEGQLIIVRTVRGDRMRKVIGVTGGIASGKSNVISIIKNRDRRGKRHG